jgi:hypothetical protein
LKAFLSCRANQKNFPFSECIFVVHLPFEWGTVPTLLTRDVYNGHCKTNQLQVLIHWFSCCHAILLTDPDRNHLAYRWCTC